MPLKSWKYFRTGDVVIVLIVLFVGFSPILFRAKNRVDFFRIKLKSKVVSEISADSDTLLIIDAPLGPVKIMVQSGSARVVESSCPHKICVHSGWINKPGQAVACVPNGLIIIAVGMKDTDKYDAILH